MPTGSVSTTEKVKLYPSALYADSRLEACYPHTIVSILAIMMKDVMMHSTLRHIYRVFLPTSTLLNKEMEVIVADIT
jgi:hypothetical protein